MNPIKAFRTLRHFNDFLHSSQNCITILTYYLITFFTFRPRSRGLCQHIKRRTTPIRKRKLATSRSQWMGSVYLKILIPFKYFFKNDGRKEKAKEDRQIPIVKTEPPPIGQFLKFHYIYKNNLDDHPLPIDVPPPTNLKRLSYGGGPVVSPRERRMSSSFFTISPNRELKKLPDLRG